MISLNIPRIKQTDKACGPTALLQVLKYYGFQKTLNELIPELKIPEEEVKTQGYAEGTIGLYALDQGFNVKMISYDTKRFDPTWNYNREEIHTNLERQLEFLELATEDDFLNGYASEYKKITTLRLVDFMKHKNAEIEFKPISMKLIEDYLLKKIPVIAIVNTCLFYSSKRRYKGTKDEIKGKEYGHVIVISGFDDYNYEITDPDDDFEKLGKFKIEKNKLINCIVQYGPVLLIIYPKN